jgi:putative tryptophan/tyrosine transport system substrate-binding protein
MLKKIILLGCFILTAVYALPATPKKIVLISQIIKHPALDRTVQGIIDGLAQKGYQRGVNVDIRIALAQASPALASQIAAKFVTQHPDVLVGVGTVSAQTLAPYALSHHVNMLFSSITDPISAGLVKHLEKPGYTISGVSNFVALAPQLQLFKRIQPHLQRLGIIYNPGELNSVVMVKRLEEACQSFGLQLIKQTAATTADVPQATVRLVAHVDAILISNDNTALAALQSIMKIAYQHHVPVYSGDTDSVALGALAAIGPNQYNIGLQTGWMIARCLKGEKAGNMSVKFPQTTHLYVNQKTAHLLGYRL